MTQQWTKSVATVEVEEQDGGDILAPLKRLQAKYLKRAEKLVATAYGEGAAGRVAASKFYFQSAHFVGLLVAQSR